MGPLIAMTVVLLPASETNLIYLQQQFQVLQLLTLAFSFLASAQGPDFYGTPPGRETSKYAGKVAYLVTYAQWRLFTCLFILP